jgi:quercetin dioxygenase-like cupin family protein
LQFHNSDGDETGIDIAEIGLHLIVRVPPSATDATMTVIETVNAPGFGPPLHRHPQAEIFRVLEGRYLYEVDGRRFYAETGDVVVIPGGAAHAFANAGTAPARQFIIIAPALDATGFFEGLADVMRGGTVDKEALRAFGLKWQVEFLGPPLRLDTEASIAPQPSSSL